MLTNDLLRLIAFDPLCSRIPVGDDAFCIQHINGVVRYAPDEESEPSFALTKLCQGLGQLSSSFLDTLLEGFVEQPQCLLGFFVSSKIDQHVHCPNQPARGVMERRRVSHEGPP